MWFGRAGGRWLSSIVRALGRGYTRPWPSHPRPREIDVELVRIRKDIARLVGYVPGEQPQEPGWIKLNTNESFECSPAALEAVRSLGAVELTRYPDPLCSGVTAILAESFGVGAERVVVGNGSDDIVNLIIRSVCGPGDRLVCTRPSYSLYPVLAAIQGVEAVEIPLLEGFALPLRQLCSTRGAVAFVASPNNPAGTLYPPDQVAELCRSGQNLVVVDEAYVEFAETNCAGLLEDFPNVCLVRSLSKAYGLAGLRVGYMVGPPDLAEAVLKVKDSYNVNRAAQAAAIAALGDVDWARTTWQGVIERRERFRTLLEEEFGLRAYPSQANFVLVDFGGKSATAAQEALRRKRILVRRLEGAPITRNCLRITIGSDSEMGVLVEALRGHLQPEAVAQ